MPRIKQQLDEEDFVVPQREEGTIASYPAVIIRQNNHTFYFTTIPSHDIFPYCYVSRRKEDAKHGFQRELSSERAKDIAKYLDASSGSIPTNIVLSAQPEADTRYIPKSKTLKFTRTPRAFLILDGQHRMYGYGLSKGDHRVPVAIYTSLSRKEECELFIDINTTQRGVPAALLIDIKQVAERESPKETHLRGLFDKLASDSESPLNGLLSPSSSAAGRISRSAFNSGVGDMLENIYVSRLSEPKQYKLLRNYFTAIDAHLSRPELLSRRVYFEAFCDIFEEVMQLSFSKYGHYKGEALDDILSGLENVDLAAIRVQGTTQVTKATVIAAIRGALQSAVQVDDSLV